MSSQRQTATRKPSRKENNVRETSESQTLQMRKQSTVVRKKQDVVTDNATRSAAKTLRTIVRKRTEDSSDDDNNEARNKTKKRPTTWQEEDDDDEDNDDDNDDNVDDECNFANSDNISKSGYSNGSDGEQQSTINDNDRDNKDDSKQVTNDTKPLYEDELEKHGQSDTVAMDVQLIKGVSAWFICRSQISWEWQWFGFWWHHLSLFFEKITGSRE